MATTTFNPQLSSAAPVARTLPAAKPGIFRRIVTAMQESRQRQAEIEIRRLRALVGDHKPLFDDALLPFRGE
jgi:hypothetical protein